MSLDEKLKNIDAKIQLAADKYQYRQSETFISKYDEEIKICKFKCEMYRNALAVFISIDERRTSNYKKDLENDQ